MEQRSRSLFAFGLALAALAAALPVCAPAADRAWRLADWNHLTAIDDVQIAPDGSRVIYAVGSVAASGESYSDEYHLVDLATGVDRRLLRTAREIGRVRWSPDGTRVAAIAEAKNGTEQVWIVSPSSGTMRRLTDSTRSITSFAWSPRGDRIAAIEYEKDATATSHAPFWVDPAADGVLVTRAAPRTLWIVNAVRGSERRLVTDGFSFGSPRQVPEPSWSSDGATIAAIRQPTAYYGDYEREEYVAIDARTGAVGPLGDRQAVALPGTASPVFSPHGARVAYIHTHDGTYAARSDVFVDGVDVSAASDRDFWSCGSTQLAWSGDALLATALDGVSTRLFSLSPGERSARALTPASGSVSSVSVSAAGRIAYAFSTPASTPELYVANADGSGAHALTHSGLPQGLRPPRTSVVGWSIDGHDLVGQLALPENASPQTPLIVEPHGGPQCADDSSFSAQAAYFASNGYAFFRPSPRGSDGYGDWSYKSIVNDFGAGPMRDVLAGIDAVEARGVSDPRRIFVEGGSYGGYLTTWMVTHGKRFRAAVAQFPVTDLALDYELSESANITKRFFGPRPVAQNAEVMERESPVRFAADMDTPLLLVAGMLDKRAPYPQTIAFYKALVDYGKDARMLLYPEMGHGPGTPRGLEDLYARTGGWFAAHGGLALPDAILPQ
jgi:dipeptidyl aminopeptidase/acylaminoacyl peptidase